MPPQKPRLTANDELTKEEDSSDGGGGEGGNWFLPCPPFSPLSPPRHSVTCTCLVLFPCYLKRRSFFSFMFVIDDSTSLTLGNCGLFSVFFS